MITTSETIATIAGAIAKATPNIASAHKDAKNPHFKSQYATLESAVKASKYALAEQDVFVVQSPGAINDGAIRMMTRLVHSSGEWIETLCDVPLQKRDAQGVGSAITYGRRYGLMAALNIPATDDDGNAASEPEPQKARKSSAQAKRDGDFEVIKSEIEATKSPEELKTWGQKNRERINALPKSFSEPIRDVYEAHRDDISAWIAADDDGATDLDTERNVA